MFDAILFDLDGTLLDIDLDTFLRAYFGALGPVLGSIAPAAEHPRGVLGALMEATNSMCRPHPGHTNREVFDAEFLRLTGADLTGPVSVRHIDDFYRNSFPALQGTCGPREGAQRAVSAARASGAKIALATNPIFPRSAIHERVRWAGLEPDGFDHITTYECSHATKPHAEYFLEICTALGVAPRDCLLVGDDASLDLPASVAGLQTFYVGPEPAHANSADWRGNMNAVADLLLSDTR